MPERDMSQYADVFAMDDGDAAPVAEPEVVTEPTPEPESTPVDPAPEPTPEAPAPQPTETDRQSNAYQALRESERARAEALVEKARLEAAMERDRQWQERLDQQQRQPVEPPDLYSDPEGYARYVREQAQAEVLPQLQQQQYQMANMIYQSSINSAKALDPKFDAYYQAVNEFAARFPSVVRDIQSDPSNAGPAIVALGKQLVAGQPTDREALKREILAEIAAERAKAGAPPPITAPRGIGSVAAGTGRPDNLPPPSEFQRLSKSDPSGYEAAKNAIFSS